MWQETILLQQNQDIFEFFIPLKYSKLDNFLYHGADNNTELPVTQLDISDGSDLNSNYITQYSNNDSGSELSSLSHVDAPNDTIYMICGVVIAMILVGLIIILVAVTINKLRKRDESSPASAVTIEAQQQHGLQSRSNSSDNNYYRENQDRQIFTTSMTDGNDNNNSSSSVELDSITFTRTSGGCNTTNGWMFPPKAPSPNIYNCINHDALATTANERNGFKGFRKQFSGRFKRLVSKKPDPISPIPPELKPQLKTIYVY